VNLPELFDPSLEGRRDLIGLEFQDRTYTFGEIDSRSNRVARWLLHNGFVAGDRLCVYLSTRDCYATNAIFHVDGGIDSNNLPLPIPDY